MFDKQYAECESQDEVIVLTKKMVYNIGVNASSRLYQLKKRDNPSENVENKADHVKNLFYHAVNTIISIIRGLKKESIWKTLGKHSSSKAQSRKDSEALANAVANDPS